ncbi:ribonuclease H-like domain-containing protein [Tanacetum coccineum]
MFTDSECLLLGKDFKLIDDNHVLLRTPRQQNMYSIDLKNIVPHKNLTCLIAKDSEDESMLWHRRLGHLNFKTMNKQVRNNLVKDVIMGVSLGKKIYEFCSRKGIKREFSNARTPQQNGIVERRNRTLIEAARTMLADAKLLVTFWAEAVNTACYVQNKVLVNKSQHKTPYELFNGRSPAIGILRPFGCHVMIFNTLDHLGKFDAKGDEGYFVGYSLNSKAFRVFDVVNQVIYT